MTVCGCVGLRFCLGKCWFSVVENIQNSSLLNDRLRFLRVCVSQLSTVHFSQNCYQCWNIWGKLVRLHRPVNDRYFFISKGHQQFFHTKLCLYLYYTHLHFKMIWENVQKYLQIFSFYTIFGSKTSNCGCQRGVALPLHWGVTLGVWSKSTDDGTCNGRNIYGILSESNKNEFFHPPPRYLLCFYGLQPRISRAWGYMSLHYF